MKETIRADGVDSLTAPTAKATPNVRSVIPLVAIFSGAFILASYFASLVELPFSNPHEIVGTLTEIRYNPSTNIGRFMLIVLLPTFALTVAFIVLPRARTQQLFPPPAAERNEAGRSIWQQKIFVPVLIVGTFLVALDTASYLSVDSLENFEEGQTLSNGMSYLNDGEERAVFTADGTRPSCDRERGTRADVARAAACAHLHRTGLDNDFAGETCIGEQAHRHHKTDCSGFTSLQIKSGEPNELLRGERDAGRRVRGIQLHDLSSATLPRVGDGERHPHLTARVHGIAREGERAVLERGVAEPVAEGEQRRRWHVEIALCISAWVRR